MTPRRAGTTLKGVMSTLPLIGYATRSGITGAGNTSPRFANNESYAYAIAENGGAPMMIPSVANEQALGAVYEVLDGLLLTGGPDVDPARYGRPRHPLTDGGDAALEQAEFYLARRALDDGLPILGICRGIQTLNVVAGGTLYQDVGDEFSSAIQLEHPADGLGRAYLAHDVAIAAQTALARAVGCTSIAVNSLHHQAVRDVAPSFAVTATAPDGLIEAIERPDRPFVVAVQWHPEELYHGEERWARLFRAFTAAALAHHERRTRR